MDRSADWMAQAQGDLAHARHDLESGFFDWASFSAQQSAAKAAKAVLYRVGAEAWGHSVADLLEALRESRRIPDDLIDPAMELDKTYISARYPDALPSGSPRSGYTRREAVRRVKHAEDIVEFCESLLSGA